MNKNIKKIKLILSIVLSINLVSCQTKFNKDVWLKKEFNDLTTRNNPRMKMTKDLMNNYLKKRMNKKEVLILLGKPLNDSIGVYMPKGIFPPDSLVMNNILKKPKNEREKYIKFLNDWYHKNYKTAPFLDYLVGWSLMDPVFLRIKLDTTKKVVDFWLEQH